MKCIRGHEVQVMSSPAGYYVGTYDEDGLPNCRISRDYARRKEDAEKLPLTRQTGCIENEFCNGGKGCFAVGGDE